jgi:plasmid stabilization system protein ParE
MERQVNIRVAQCGMLIMTLVASLAALAQQIKPPPESAVDSVRSSQAPKRQPVDLVLNDSTALDINTNPLKLREQAAVLAERNHDKAARKYWMQLAEAEVSAKLLARGLAHAHHVIDTYSAIDVIDRRDVLQSSYGIVQLLVNEGEKKEAEQLLIDAVNQAKAIAGPESVAAQAQLTDLFSFYVDQQNDTRALATLDKILLLGLTSCETPSQGRMHFHYGPGPAPQPSTATEIVVRIRRTATNLDQKRHILAQEILNKLLVAQRCVFFADDERLVATLDDLAAVDYRASNYVEAEKFYKQSYDISRLYHGESTAL